MNHRTRCLGKISPKFIFLFLYEPLSCRGYKNKKRDNLVCSCQRNGSKSYRKAQKVKQRNGYIHSWYALYNGKGCYGLGYFLIIHQNPKAEEQIWTRLWAWSTYMTVWIEVSFHPKHPSHFMPSAPASLLVSYSNITSSRSFCRLTCTASSKPPQQGKRQANTWQVYEEHSGKQNFILAQSVEGEMHRLTDTAPEYREPGSETHARALRFNITVTQQN